MLRRVQKIAIVLLAVALMISSLCPAFAMSVSSQVNANTKVYKQASVSSASVSVNKGTNVTMKDVSGSWAKVQKYGNTGFMKLRYLNANSRYIAYINRNTYVYRTASTASSRCAVSVNSKVYVIGKSGSFSCIQNMSGTASGYIPSSYISRNKVSVSQSTSWKSKVVKMNWFNGGSSVLATGSYAYLYDIDTGTIIRIKRMGGHNHMDVEPATATDTAKMKKMCGGSFSWASRAVILRAGGKYIACAINTMPHGDQTIRNNNYDGQFCLHMVDSRTHGTDKVNANHQNAINRAYNWAH